MDERRSKSLETYFLIAICRPTGNKTQLKRLFLSIYDPRSLIVKTVFDCQLSGAVLESRILAPIGLFMRTSIFRVCDHIRLKEVCLVTKTI